ncbi:unnamed protein product [Clonostachys solani]|uniref:Uncharacterized protein n=1 Tax=Clonostachys solani TaxID=160281 RepID=A0A9N9ZA61_9HYPO|nr:unnamed protein product [Clonostachys solani]
MSFLINIDAVMPADVNDNDITEDGVFQTSTQPTQMSAMIFKIRLFRLSSKICQAIENLSHLDEITLGNLDAEVGAEQHQWDSVFLVDGSPSLLDTSSYAHWCVLQLYAHQLYLLLHRPFSHPQPTNGRSYLAASREKCIASGAALLDIHRQLVELPRLRHYRWYAHGMSGFCAFHGAVALASCLLAGTSEEFESRSYRAMFDGAVLRIGLLQNKSPICVKAYPILGHLQSLLSPSQFQWSDSAGHEFGYSFDNWIDTIQWLNPDSVNWDVWDSVLHG